MFEHDEYHIYTTAAGIEKVHVHLTEQDLREAETLANRSIDVDGDWEEAYRLEVAENTYLSVGDGVWNGPRLASSGYEGWEPVTDGDFEDAVFFDSMLFYKCVGTYGEPDWSFADTKEWVDYEHRGQFEREFDEYLANYSEDDVSVDW